MVAMVLAAVFNFGQIVDDVLPDDTPGHDAMVGGSNFIDAQLTNQLKSLGIEYNGNPFDLLRQLSELENKVADPPPDPA